MATHFPKSNNDRSMAKTQKRSVKGKNLDGTFNQCVSQEHREADFRELDEIESKMPGNKGRGEHEYLETNNERLSTLQNDISVCIIFTGVKNCKSDKV